MAAGAAFRRLGRAGMAQSMDVRSAYRRQPAADSLPSPAAGTAEAGRLTHGAAMPGYYDAQHLKDFGKITELSPDLGRKFFDYYGAVFADGALTAREKSLIALAVAHAVQCPYCIDAYTDDSLQKGADIEQMAEAVHVAVAIRGGASLVHGMQMRERAQKQGM
jgi:4-carboxymuconolactone decarboxylase